MRTETSPGDSSLLSNQSNPSNLLRTFLLRGWNRLRCFSWFGLTLLTVSESGSLDLDLDLGLGLGRSFEVGSESGSEKGWGGGGGSNTLLYIFSSLSSSSPSWISICSIYPFFSGYTSFSRYPFCSVSLFWSWSRLLL